MAIVRAIVVSLAPHLKSLEEISEHNLEHTLGLSTVKTCRHVMMTLSKSGVPSETSSYLSPLHFIFLRTPADIITYSSVENA